jgi:hypothetical protein
MEIMIEVKMKTGYIYDLLLFHTYSKFSGFIINVLGLAVIVTGGLHYGSGKVSAWQCAIYIVVGIGFLAYTPLNLWRRSRQMIKAPKYQNSIYYKFDENGFDEIIKEHVNHYSWSQVQKAIATPKNIAFYVEDETAVIVPKESFGDHFMPVMKLIADNIARDKIYIR